jgi:hypothetical protein
MIALRLQSLFTISLLLLFGTSVFSQENRLESDFGKYLTNSPVQLAAGHHFYGDIPYDSHNLTNLDLWVPEGEGKGLIIYIHGGGFKGGDKNSAWNKPSKFGIGPDQINQFLNAGLAFASVNYRLLVKEEKEGVIKALNDAKSALQFLRYHSNALEFDGGRIGLAGTSAGAGTALWLGVNDDLSNAEAADPISQVSTRVSAIGLRETQSTYDILRWFGDVFPKDLYPIERIPGTALEKRIINFYGVEDWNDLYSEDLVAYRASVDMLSMIDSSDPPVYILNNKDFNPEKGSLVGNLLHSPYHAVALRSMFKEMGVHHEVFIPSEGGNPRQTLADFLIEELFK